MKILIFGAHSDLGIQLAHYHASQGDVLILTARNFEQLQKSKADLEIRYSISVEVFELEACLYETHPALLANMKLKDVDIVYCVFGYMGSQEKAIQNFEESRQIIEVNFLAAVSLLNIVANVFEEKKAGIIVGISSVAGERGRQSNYLYGSAKAGFSSYLDGMRNRLSSQGVHVMTVKPGFMRTKMTEGLPLPGPLTANPDKAAKLIARAALKKKNIFYVPPIWRLIMMIIRNIPEFLFKKLNI